MEPGRGSRAPSNSGGADRCRILLEGLNPGPETSRRRAGGHGKDTPVKRLSEQKRGDPGL